MPWLKKCLDSCAAYAVIIVDNASTDITVSFIETNYPDVTIFRQADNLGFGQANNIGIRYALDQGAEHVFLLNQDAYLVDSVLDELVVFQKQHSNYGVLSPIHITGDQKKLDNNFSNFMLKEKTGQFYSDFVLGNNLAAVYEVPFINAAAWLISRKCLETVGGFDPLFFHYGEDENYCQRVVFHDLKIGVLPQCYVIHDREYRQKNKSRMFSKAYYNMAEISYKIKLANILLPFTIKKSIRIVERGVFKMFIQLRIKKAYGFSKEFILLKSICKDIEESRKRNLSKGSHYL